MFFCVCYPLSMIAGRWERKLKERDRITVTPEETNDAKEATA